MRELRGWRVAVGGPRELSWCVWSESGAYSMLRCCRAVPLPVACGIYGLRRSDLLRSEVAPRTLIPDGAEAPISAFCLLLLYQLQGWVFHRVTF